MRVAWVLAFLWLTAFAGGLAVVFAPIRAYLEHVNRWGMDPFEVSPGGVAVALALFALGHGLPVLLRPRRLTPRFALELGGARHYRAPAERREILVNGDALERARAARRGLMIGIGVTSALGIASTGYFVLRFTFHGPRQDPLEFLAYFWFALFTLVTHAPRVTFYSGLAHQEPHRPLRQR